MDQEQSARVLLIGGVILIVVVALAFVAFGYYWTEIRPERRTVLRVDETSVSYAGMKRRMNYELFADSALQQDPTTLPSVAEDALIKELINIQRADDAGVTVSPEEIDTALRQRIGVSADSDQRAFQDALRRQLDATGLTESEFRRLVSGEAYELAIKRTFESEIPAAAEQAKVEAINAENQEVAQEAIDRINAGEPFADVAKELSIAPSAAENGGMLDYEPRETMTEAYRDFAFTAAVGELSGPLPVEGGLNFYVVRVVDRSEQPIAPEDKPGIAGVKYEDWLAVTEDTMREDGSIVVAFDETARNEALADVYGDAQDRLLEQQIAQLQQQTAIAAQQTTAALTPQPTPAPVTPGATVSASTPPANETPEVPEAPAPSP